MSDKKKRQIVKSMEDEDDIEPVSERIDVPEPQPRKVIIDFSKPDPEPLNREPWGGGEPEPKLVALPPLASDEHKPLLARALPFLLTYSHSGRGARCPECGQVIGHRETCKLAGVITEIEAVTK